MGAPGRVSPQERLEGTAAGRVLISIAILFTLLAVAVTNLPGTSHLRQSLEGKTQPYLNAIGLDQNWGVFAPDPRRESIGLRARITYADGGVEWWDSTERDPVIGTYSDYRWRKLMENIVADAGKSYRSTQMALWVARERRGRREAPLNVGFFKRVSPNPPPGAPGSEDRQPYQESQISDLPIAPGTLEGDGP